LSYDGILNINKPMGKTSFEVVSFVRRLSGERRVGHGGTLDPQAEGVLPVCLGQGTRVVQFLSEGEKVYRAQVELGTATDTYDASGKVAQRGDASAVTRELVESILALFRGSIGQVPPMYSALKYRGKPLYRLARAGVEVPRRQRKVHISLLEISDFQLPSLTLEIACSKGTYIRSLAHDIGQALGCGAHLSSLLRLRSGPFHISDSITLPQLEAAFREGLWQDLLYPLDTVLQHMMAIIVAEEGGKALLNGRPLTLGAEEVGGRCRAYSCDGRIIALLRFRQGLWHPEKVFSTRA
jgi:tRNA pseudouridine55 synthase